MKGMSDWNLAELEDINWDELGKNDDHTVPRRAGELASVSLVLGDSHKRPPHEVKNDVGKSMYNTETTNKTVFWANEDAYHPPVKDGSPSLMEGSRSHASNVVVPELLSTDCNARDSFSSSQDVKISDYCVNGCNLFTYSNMAVSKDSIQGNAVSTKDNNKSGLSSLNGTSSNVTDLSFLQNERDADLGYYDWPDISNFDEIDKMFRNWDSAFGQGQTGTADELSWFSSSSNTNYGLDIGFEPGLQSSGSELVALHAKLEPRRSDSNFLPPNAPAAAGHGQPSSSIYTDWAGTCTQPKDKSTNEEKLCDKGDNMERRAQSQISNARCLDESGSSTVMEIERQQTLEGKGTKRSTDQMLSHCGASDDSASQMDSSEQFSQQKTFMGSSPGYLHNLGHSSQLEFGLPTQQPFSLTTSSGEIRKETNPSLDCTAPYHLLNHPTQCLERLPDQLYMAGMGPERQQLCSIMTTEHPHQQPSFRNIASNEKKQLETGAESEAEDIGVRFCTFNTDHLKAQGSFSDDISEKATTFQQLQGVMHQLDDRTKLCIRDSLYRLARSARQRNIFASRSCSGVTTIAKGNECPEASKDTSADFLDAETDTNPIDRSIAHLLFHKPSESASRSTNDASRVMALAPNQFDQQQIFGGCKDMSSGLQ